MAHLSFTPTHKLPELHHPTGRRRKERVLLMNSGAEANESAIKIARKWVFQNRGIGADEGTIITFSNNFHGRTITLVSGSDNELARDGFGPLNPGFTVVDFGDIDAVVEIVASRPVVAVLIEPIQGEAGVVLPSKDFLQQLRQLTLENGIVLIADEIQSGMGRTGRLFACDHFDIVPDLYTVGKALGAGILPVSAVLGDEKFLNVLTPGTHGSTFGGNPFAAAVVSAVVAEISDPDFLPRVASLGETLHAGLQDLAMQHGVVGVRSIGLWAAIDIDPDFVSITALVEEVRRRGLLVKEARGRTLRMTPPAVVTHSELRHGIEQIREAVRTIATNDSRERREHSLPSPERSTAD